MGGYVYMYMESLRIRGFEGSEVHDADVCSGKCTRFVWRLIGGSLVLADLILFSCSVCARRSSLF